VTQQLASFDPALRRAGVRRTVWITAALALAFFVGFFVLQALSH